MSNAWQTRGMSRTKSKNMTKHKRRKRNVHEGFYEPEPIPNDERRDMQERLVQNKYLRSQV